MKRHLLVVALLASACGKSSTGPSDLNLVGGWTGTATLSGQDIATGFRATNVCSTTWIVATHVASAISGTFQLSGGTLVNCAQAGTFSGSVSSSGSVSIAFASGSGGPGGSSGCVHVSGDSGFSGVVSAATMTLQQSQRANCTGQLVDQNVTISLTKR